MKTSPLKFLRKICLSFPETIEETAWGDPTFRIKGKIFAMYKTGDGRVSVWCKAQDGAQSALTYGQPAVFFVPPYVGRRGWIGIRLDVDIDKRHITCLLKESYKLTASKSLRALVE